MPPFLGAGSADSGSHCPVAGSLSSIVPPRREDFWPAREPQGLPREVAQRQQVAQGQGVVEAHCLWQAQQRPSEGLLPWVWLADGGCGLKCPGQCAPRCIRPLVYLQPMVLPTGVRRNLNIQSCVCPPPAQTWGIGIMNAFLDF